jgi:hypothetical protein
MNRHSDDFNFYLSAIKPEILFRARIDKSALARAHATYLQDDIFLDLDVMGTSAGSV